MDPAKDLANQAKHEISFFEAQYAFSDPRRVIAEDVAHSTALERGYFCFGKCGDGVLTVRFTYRQGVIGILVRGIGRGIYACMKKPIKYTNEPLGRLNVVEDFLPPPSELVFRENTAKVTAPRYSRCCHCRQRICRPTDVSDRLKQR